MSNQMVSFDSGQMPAHLQGVSTGVGTQLMQSVGVQRNRIGLKGNRFRIVIGGQEVSVRDENFLDVVIVGAAPYVSRVFYEGSYDATAKDRPSCYSVDNITPAPDVEQPMSTKCATCPMNEKGSRITDNGQKTRACSFFRRMALWVVGDDTGTVFQLDAKAMSIFAQDNKNNQFSLNEYARWLAARGIDPGVIVTRLTFDTNSSVPKLLFTPTRYTAPDESEFVMSLVGSQEVDDVLKVDISTVDHSVEADKTPAPTADEIAPAPASTGAPAPRAAAPAPAKPRAPAPKPAAPAPAAAAPPAPAARAPAQRAPAASVTQLNVAKSTPAPAPVAAAPQSDSDMGELSDLLADLDDLTALEG